MKNFRLTILCGLCGWALTAQSQVTPVSQMEKLGRGVIALPASSSGKFVSWRLLGTEDVERTTFDVLRDGKVIKRLWPQRIIMTVSIPAVFIA